MNPKPQKPKPQPLSLCENTNSVPAFCRFLDVRQMRLSPLTPPAGPQLRKNCRGRACPAQLFSRVVPVPEGVGPSNEKAWPSGRTVFNAKDAKIAKKKRFLPHPPSSCRAGLRRTGDTKTQRKNIFSCLKEKRRNYVVPVVSLCLVLSCSALFLDHHAVTMRFQRTSH